MLSRLRQTLWRHVYTSTSQVNSFSIVAKEDKDTEAQYRLPTATSLHHAPSSDERQLVRIHYANDCNTQSRCDRRTQMFASSLLNVHSFCHKRVVKISETMARFVSTSSRVSSNGTGIPIEDEQESLLAQAKGNKSVKINACGELYAKLSEEKPSMFRRAPKNVGIDFDVKYFDSMELIKTSGNARIPTVCLLHGAPGHYKDFASLINYLTGKGIRVVAPTFPTYSATYEYSFRHTPLERLDYLLEFYKAIDLKVIDMLIGHSGSVFTVFELLEYISKSKQLDIKSFGLLNTPSYNLPRTMEVTPFRTLSLKLFDYPIFRPFLVAIIHTFAKFQGIKTRIDTDKIEDFLIAACVVGYSNTNKAKENLKLFHSLKKPTYLLVSGKDKLLPMRCFEQLKSDLGITSDRQVRLYKDDGDLVHDAEDLDELIEVSQFPSGGHYTFQRFSHQVNHDIYTFLKRKVIPNLGKEEATKL